MRRAVFWLLTAILILSPIAATEMLLRWWGLGTPVLYDSVGNDYWPRANQSLSRIGGAHVTVGSTGLRGRSSWVAAGDRHVLFLGDSVTWGGSQIDDRDTFAEVACAGVGRAIGKKIVCGNAGVDAYGIDNMLWRLARIQGWDALVVTLIANDTIRGNTDFKGLPFFSRQPTGPLKACWEAAGILTFRLAETLLKHPHWQDESDLARADAALDRLLTALRIERDSGKPVLLVYSPGEHDRPEPPFSTHVRERMATSGLPLLDMTDVVAKSTVELYLDGTHLNAAGHHLYGQAIAAKLAEIVKEAPAG